VLDSTSTTQPTTPWSLTSHAKPRHAIHQEALVTTVSCGNQLYRRITQPARPNAVTGTLADLPRSRAELLAENAQLRRQLNVLHRRTKTPRLTWRARLALLLLASWASKSGLRMRLP